MRKFLALSCVALNITDAALTYYGLTHRHGIEELNPYVAWLMSHVGIAEGLILSKIQVALGIWILYRSEYYSFLIPMNAAILGFAVIPWLVMLATTAS